MNNGIRHQVIWAPSNHQIEDVALFVCWACDMLLEIQAVQWILESYSLLVFLVINEQVKISYNQQPSSSHDMSVQVIPDVVTGWPEHERPKYPSTAMDFDICSPLWRLLSCGLLKFSSWALILFSGDDAATVSHTEEGLQQLVSCLSHACEE